MSDAHEDGTVVDRRTMIKRVGILGVVAGAAVTGAATPASARGGKRFVLDIDTHAFADFQQVDNGGGTGPFYVSGDILARNTTTVIGTFHCWGWIRSPDGLGVVNQEFDIDERGKILIAGVESDAPRAVSGGTEDFALARGQGFPDIALFDFPNSGKFRIEFRLTSARGRPIR